MSNPARFAATCDRHRGMVSAMAGPRSTVGRFHPAFLHTFTLLNPLCPAVKGVAYRTLIRLGIAWGKGPGAYDKGTFGTHWGCHSSRYIDVLYKALLAKLKESKNGNPFGPFDSLSLLIGDRNARIFCQRHIGVSSRPPPSNNRTTDEEDEEIGGADMDVDEDEVLVL